MPRTPDELAQRFPTLAGTLSGDDLAALHRALTPRSLAVGEALLVEGQTSASLWLVTAGRLRATVRTATGVLDVATLTAGDLVAEISFIDGGLSTASITALEPSTAAALTREALDGLVETHPTVAAHVLESVCATLVARLRAATERFDDLAPGEAIPDEAPGLLERIYTLFGLSRG